MRRIFKIARLIVGAAILVVVLTGARIGVEALRNNNQQGIFGEELTVDGFITEAINSDAFILRQDEAEIDSLIEFLFDTNEVLVVNDTDDDFRLQLIMRDERVRITGIVQPAYVDRAAAIADPGVLVRRTPERNTTTASVVVASSSSSSTSSTSSSTSSDSSSSSFLATSSNRPGANNNTTNDTASSTDDEQPTSRVQIIPSSRETQSQQEPAFATAVPTDVPQPRTITTDARNRRDDSNDGFVDSIADTIGDGAAAIDDFILDIGVDLGLIRDRRQVDLNGILRDDVLPLYANMPVLQVRSVDDLVASPRIEDIIFDPEEFFGREISIDGNVSEVLASNAFVIRRSGSADPLIVIETSDFQIDDIFDSFNYHDLDVNSPAGSYVRVYGQIMEFGDPALQDNVDVDLNDPIFSQFDSDDIVLVADEIQETFLDHTVDGITDDPERFFNHEIELEGTVAEMLTETAFSIRGDNLDYFDRLLVLYDTIGEVNNQVPGSDHANMILALNEGDRVRVGGIVSVFVEDTIEEEFEFDDRVIDSIVFEDFEGEAVLIANTIIKLDN